MDRDSFDMAMLAAWLNVRVDQIPLDNRAHLNPDTMAAWRRVGEAAVEHAAGAALRTALPSTEPVTVDALWKAVKPWEFRDGPVPDYDHPLSQVFESGCEYAVKLLAKTLGVTDYEACDGTEEFDGDLGGTLFNVVLAAMPKNADGDEMHPEEVRAALASPPATEKQIEADAARYRWLRDHSCPPHNFYISVPDEFSGIRYGASEVDDYVDAAIAALNPKQSNTN